MPANNIVVLDGLSVQQTLRTFNNGGVHVPIHQTVPATTTTVTRVAASLSSVPLAPAGSTRVGIEMYNDSAGTMYVLRGSGVASVTNYSFQLESGEYFSDSPTNYQGAFTAIWTDTSGGVMVTELLE